MENTIINYNWGGGCCNIHITGVLEGKKRGEWDKNIIEGTND